MNKRRRSNLEGTHLVCRLCGAELMFISEGHLNKHGYTIARYKRRFNVAFVISPFLRLKLSRRKKRQKAEAGRYRPLLTKESIIAELRKAACAYDPTQKTFSNRWFNRTNGWLVRQAVHVFGSWPKARRACGWAGLRNVKLGAADLVARLRNVAVAGEPLAYMNIKRHDPALIPLLKRRYGSVLNACRALGLPFQQIRKRMSNAEIRLKLLAWYKSDRLFSMQQVEQQDPRLVTTAVHRYGTWAKTLHACGLDLEAIRRARKEAHRANLVARIKAWAQIHGGLSAKAVRAEAPKLYNQMRIHYGGVREAARVLAIPCTPDYAVWTRERVLMQLKARQRKCLRLSRSAIKRDCPGLFPAAVKYFGSWSRAKAMIGEKIECRIDFAARKAKLRAEAEAWTSAHGELSTSALRRSAPSLLDRLKKYMGGIRSASKAWGLPRYMRALKWSKETVRAAIIQRINDGATITARAVRRRGEACGLYAAARKFHGSWTNALAAASAPLPPG